MNIEHTRGISPLHTSFTKSEAIAPPGTPEHLVSGVSNVLRAVDRTTTQLPIAIAEDWTETSFESANTFYKNVSEAALVPPDHPILDKTYKKLTRILTDDSASDISKYKAFFIGDALRHQAGLPILEKKFYQDVKSLANIRRDTTIEQTAEYLEAEAAENPSTNVFGAFVQASESYIASTLATVQTPPDDREKYLQVIKDQDTRIKQNKSIMYHMLHENVAPATAEQLREVVRSSHELVNNKHAESLLLDGALEDVTIHLRHVAWAYAMWMPQDMEQGFDKSALGTYFFDHTDLQEDYWDDIAKSRDRMNSKAMGERVPESMSYVPNGYPETEWFFLQNGQTIEKYFETFQDGETNKDTLSRVTSLVSFVGTFQTLHPDHENIPALHAAVTKLAAEKRVGNKIATHMDILSDKEPGVVTLKSFGPDATIQMRDQTLEDIVSSDASLLYQSKAEIKTKAQINDEKNAASSVESQETKFVLNPGEQSFIPLWHEVQEPNTKDVPSILTHIEESLASKEPSEDSLFDLATQPIKLPARERAAVLPSLLDNDHPLSSLDDAGIVSVQRVGDEFSFILDTRKAGIETDGSPLVLLKGEKDSDDVLHVSNAPASFDGSLTHLALTGAALLTYRTKPKEMKTGRKITERLDRMRTTVTAWNGESKQRGYPKIDTSVPTMETAVVVPVTHADVVLMTLKER